jgi:hypothetical protein
MGEKMATRDVKDSAENLIMMYIHEKMVCARKSGETESDDRRLASDLLAHLKTFGFVPGEERGAGEVGPWQAAGLIADFFHSAMLCGHALGENSGESIAADLAYGDGVVDRLRATGIVFRALR